MKLSISNIAWSKDDDISIYNYLKDREFCGLEIAPTRIFEETPYDKIDEAKDFALMLKDEYNLTISSMQSIWYGRNERIFNSYEERKSLISYTKKAIDFASAVKCNNLVFGSPRNRVINNENDKKIALEFFYELGEYAKEKDTILSIEPNPVLYNTNFINYTSEAFELVKNVKSEGLKVNVDLGTIIYNGEDLSSIIENIDLVNHIHISEPNLVPIQERSLHNQLEKILRENNYEKFVSIEMGNCNDIEKVKYIIEYVRGVFK